MRGVEREANTGVHSKPVVNPNTDPDSLRVGWVFKTHEHSVAPQIRTVPDTGSDVVNYGLGALYSWRNLFAALDSLPLGILADVNKEFDRLGIPLEALPFDAAPALLAEQTEYVAARAARDTGNASKIKNLSAALKTPSPLPEVVIHYDPVFAANPEHSNWYRFVIEALQENQGGSLTRVLGRNEKRLATDGTLRRLARKELETLGFDLSDLQAGHPADSIINPYIQGGDVGTTYYFIEARVNGAFGRQFSQQLNILGVQKGGRFSVTFTGPWPNFAEFPPIAPLASSPRLR